jgi:Zn-dependent protease with chaperone function
MYRAGGKNALVVALTLQLIALTISSAGSVSDYQRVTYEYSVAEVMAAAEHDLDSSLAPYQSAGQLNRETQLLKRVRHVFAALIKVARYERPASRDIAWRIYLHDGRTPEAYSRASGQIVLSAGFLERYEPGDAQLAFIIGHEIAHVLCEHERIRLSAVWKRNAPYQLRAQYAMEYLDTEPMVRAQIATVANAQERTADRIGLELAAAIGADPLDALGLFNKSVAAEGGGMMPDVHDPAVERRAALLRDLPVPAGLLKIRQSARLNCTP